MTLPVFYSGGQKTLSLLTFIRYKVTNRILQFNFTNTQAKSLGTKFLKKASYDIKQVKQNS